MITVISGQEIESVSQIQEMLLKFSKEQEIQVNVMRQERGIQGNFLQGGAELSVTGGRRAL